jgi:tRNA(fMet)-specific endonuclease VapC
MRYMLDTNIVSDLIRNPAGKAAKRSQKVGDDALCVSIITAAELRFGAAHRASPRLTERVEQLLGELTVVAFKEPADAAYAGIRLALQQAGQPIGPNDLLIAAHAMTVGAVLVTANDREFRRVRGLKVENWLGA